MKIKLLKVEVGTIKEGEVCLVPTTMVDPIIKLGETEQIYVATFEDDKMPDLTIEIKQ